jgi:hypothetical protein
VTLECRSLWQYIQRLEIVLKSATPAESGMDTNTLRGIRKVAMQDFLKGALPGYASQRSGS